MGSALRKARFALFLITALTASVATAAAAKSYSAERFDSRVRVLPGGALEVTETVVFRFESGTFDHVSREIPARRTDGIEIVSASLDGRPFPRGAGVNQIEVTGHSKVRVQWRFQPLADSAHVFVLTYMARGVVTQGSDADVLAWRALPSEHQYEIDSSTVSFELPGSVSRLDATRGTTPKIEWHRIDGAVNSATQPSSEDNTPAAVVVRATAQQIRANGWIEATFDLPRGSVLTTAPAWQQAQQTARAFAPRWITAAALIAVAGLIMLFGLRQGYDAPSRDQSTMPGSRAVPDNLPAGLVGPLLANGRASAEHAMATLLSLAGRGVITIEERPHGLFGQHNFDVRRRETRTALAGHESALLAAGLNGAKEGEAVPLSSVRRRVARRIRQFTAAVQQDLMTAGLIDANRRRVRSRYFRLAAVVLVLSGLSVITVGATLASRYGGWPMFIPAAFAAVGMTSLIFAAATTPLSDEGLRRGARWRGFRGYLRTVSQGREQAPLEGVQALLPFAVATGLTATWARYLKRHPGSVPSWFRALSSGSQDSAFTAFMTSTAGAHGGGGSSSGGGAAGGGSSGAG